MSFSYFQVWRVVFFPIRNQTLDKFFNWKLCFSKQHKNCNKWRFHGLKWTKRWRFDCNRFSEIWHEEKFLIQNMLRWIFFQYKIWRNVVYSVQNMTRIQKIDLKPDTLKNVQIKIWSVVKSWYKVWHVESFLTRNLTLCSI